MGIKTLSDYVKFYVGLNMQSSISLSSFVYNEKLVLKNKLDQGKVKREHLIEGLKILDELLLEIKATGEKAVLEKYSK
ncbi:MAG: hypothetical protein KGH95_06975 [Thaumarchaeota archaeon]|nr:hypothetical protein [Nitrososphaerota archaeon]